MSSSPLPLVGPCCSGQAPEGPLQGSEQPQPSPRPRLPRHGHLITNPDTHGCPLRSPVTWPRKDGKEGDKVSGPRPSALVIPFPPPTPSVQAPDMIVPIVQVPPKAVVTLCGSYTIIKGLGWVGEILCSFFSTSSNSKNEYPIQLSGHICIPFWINVLLCYQKASPLWLISVSDSLSSFPSGLCTKSPYSVSICSREYPGGSRQLCLPLSLQPPHPKPVG